MDILTDGKLRTKIRGALRKIWRDTRSREYVNLVRMPYVGTGRFQYAVKCEMCDLQMGLSEREHLRLKSGRLTSKPRLVYEVDHLEANHEFLKFDDLGHYAKSLFDGNNMNNRKKDFLPVKYIVNSINFISYRS